MNDDAIEALQWNGWPAPDEYLAELGRLNALWSGFETFLNMCVAKLAGFQDFSEVPFILIHHASLPQRIDMLGALCEYLIGKYPHLKSHRTVIGKIREAQKLRNNYAHNGIHFDQETQKVITSKGSARGQIKTSVTEIRIADLRRVSVAIDEANRALYALVLKVEISPAWERDPKLNPEG